MPKMLLIALAVAAGTSPVALADSGTNKPGVWEDGGVTYVGDPPGMALTVDDRSAPADGRVQDGGAAQPDAVPSEADLQQLRDQVARLDQQLAATSDAEAQTEQLQRINDQLSALRRQLAREQARSAAGAAAAQQAMAQTESAVEVLTFAYQRLAYGDSHVLDQLDYAEPALPYPAQRALDDARGALEAEDLAGARYWINLAIVETQRAQLGP